VVPDDELQDAKRRIGRGVSRVLPRGSTPDLLLSAIGDLIVPSPRLPVRAMVVLAYRTDDGVSRGLVRTRDISRTGMLMEGGRELPVNAVFGFQLHLPGAAMAVEGEARVVRHTDPQRERTHGIGAAFLPLTGADRSSLDDFLARTAAPLRA
jgi:hypothetical protein